jgi:hypothetical protein
MIVRHSPGAHSASRSGPTRATMRPRSWPICGRSTCRPTSPRT